MEFPEYNKESEYVPFYSILLPRDEDFAPNDFTAKIVPDYSKFCIDKLSKSFSILKEQIEQKKTLETEEQANVVIFTPTELVQYFIDDAKRWIFSEPNLELHYNKTTSSSLIFKMGNIFIPNTYKAKLAEVNYEGICGDLFLYLKDIGIMYSLMVKRIDVPWLRAEYITTGKWNLDKIEFWIREEFLDFQNKLSKTNQAEFVKNVSDFKTMKVVKDFKDVYNTFLITFKTISEKKKYLSDIEDKITLNIQEEIKALTESVKIEQEKSLEFIKKNEFIIL